jgi:DNA-3-methyladenine glycosylase
MTSPKAEHRPLDRGFYTRPTLTVAEELLGKRLVRQVDGATLVGRIVEVEAYIGEDDPACHARFGRTGRNSVMYGQGGFSYIYFIYGMYNMFNIVTEREGFPAAVLVRAVEPLEGIGTMQRLRGTSEVGNLSNGPGKLCRAFGLDTSHSGVDLTGKAIYVSECEDADYSIAISSRIGIRQGTERKWRFYIEGNSFVSRSAQT